MYLALIYQELAPERVVVAPPNLMAITVLAVAEGITYPFDGVRTQATYAHTLVKQWKGDISAERVDQLTAAQMHALRSPVLVWPEVKTICHHCAKKLPSCVKSQCKACKRALYCSADCQKQYVASIRAIFLAAYYDSVILRDWSIVHKVACKVWRLVNVREKRKSLRKQIKKLVLDPVGCFPA